MRPVETASVVGDPDTVPTDRPQRTRRRVLLIGLAVVGVLVVLALWWFIPTGPPPLTAADVDRAVQTRLEQAKQLELNAPADATTAYQTISSSLVTVTTQRPGQAGAGATENGLGSGVIINAGGAVLTALHVVDGAQQIQVEFADGTKAAAQVATSRAEKDVAVLTVDRLPDVIVPAILAGPPPVGATVFAVGNPLGLRGSLTSGVVSATGRGIGTENGATLNGLIQFDAAVNPGNSGGPLLNRDGQVVGIVTALANPARQDFFVGIGFAVPIATASGVAGGPEQ